MSRKRMIKLWIKKYILHIASPSMYLFGYKYEYDYFRDKKRGTKA